MKNLTARRSRARVVEKLLGLGLVAERKELHKKRRRKGHGPELVQGGAGEGIPGVLPHHRHPQNLPLVPAG